MAHQVGLRLWYRMIIEGILTTENADGSVNIAPMGPRIEEDWQRLVLRPYRTSTTYANLRRRGEGVFHVTDDVELLARSAIGRLETVPPLAAISEVNTPRLADTCRWYALRVESLDDRQERTQIVTRVVGMGRLRDFAGFHRARHAVVEAAILATRVGLLPVTEIYAQFEQFRSWVDKTGGPAEQRAFALLEGYVREHDPHREQPS